MGLHPFNPAKWRLKRNYRLAVANLIAVAILKEQEIRITNAFRDIRLIEAKFPKRKKKASKKEMEILRQSYKKLKERVAKACSSMVEELKDIREMDINDFTLAERAAKGIIRFGERLEKAKQLDGTKRNELTKSLTNLRDAVKKKKLEMNNLITGVTNLIKISEEIEPLPSWWFEFGAKKRVIEIGQIAKRLKKDNGECLMNDYSLLSRDINEIGSETNLLTRRLLERLRRIKRGLKARGLNVPEVGKTEKVFKKLFIKIRRAALVEEKDIVRKSSKSPFEIKEAA